LKEAALLLANLTNSTIPIQVYSDGSSFEGGIGAAALLYINDHLARVLWVYLGTTQKHTVYEAEGVSIIMGLHLLNGLSHRLTHPTVLGTDSQAVAKALKNQCSQPGHCLLDAIHHAAECLHAKQDGLINSDERRQALAEGSHWKSNTKGVINLQLHWVLGHCDFEPNECTDEEAKLAMEGKILPQLPHKKLPLSISTLHQENIEKLKRHWHHRWKTSERENLLRAIDNSVASKNYFCLTVYPV
jgi:ribonuclease HI